MLTLGQPLVGKNILSLQTGGPVGAVNDIIINPNNLKIEGWHAADAHKRTPVILLSQDIRDILPQGFVVNDHRALTEHDDLIRLKKILSYKFTLVGKAVVTNRKKRLGKVSDYAFEKNGFFIQKLYVSQSILRSFSGGTLTIDRTQIVEITHRHIVVKEATAEEKAPLAAVA